MNSNRLGIMTAILAFCVQGANSALFSCYLVHICNLLILFLLFLDFYWLVDVKLLNWAFPKLLAVAFLRGESSQAHHIISKLLAAEIRSLRYVVVQLSGLFPNWC